MNRPFDIPNCIRAIDRSAEVSEAYYTPHAARCYSPAFTLEGSGLDAREEAMARSVAAHEAGHHLIAEVYGLNPRCILGAPGEGRCWHRRGTDEEVETLSWGGIIAEDLLGVRKPGRLKPETVLSHTSDWTVYDWASEVRVALRRNDPKEVGLSWSDQEFISGFSNSGLPLRAHKLLVAHLPELRELADTLYATFKPAVIQARSLSNEVVQASLSKPPDGDKPPSGQYGYSDAVTRMMAIEQEARRAAKEAFQLGSEADALSEDAARLGALAGNPIHRDAAADHEFAMEACLAAAAAAKDYNEGWAAEFCKLRAAGDTAGARKAAVAVDLKTPLKHKRHAEKHAEQAVRHFHAARLSKL